MVHGRLKIAQLFLHFGVLMKNFIVAGLILFASQASFAEDKYVRCETYQRNCQQETDQRISRPNSLGCLYGAKRTMPWEKGSEMVCTEPTGYPDENGQPGCIMYNVRDYYWATARCLGPHLEN